MTLRWQSRHTVSGLRFKTLDKLCIFGTRTFYENREAEMLIDEALTKARPDMVVTAGDAEGVCQLAIDKSSEHGIPCELHWLQPSKYAAGKYEHRSKEALKSSTRVLFVHDGKSKGTLNEKELAEKMGLPIEYHKIKAEEKPWELPEVEISIEGEELEDIIGDF